MSQKKQHKVKWPESKKIVMKKWKDKKKSKQNFPRKEEKAQGERE